MARLLCPQISIIRGSVAGTTYTANTFHQIIARQRTAPVQPGTNFQNMIRSSFTAASSVWRGLEQTSRDAWNDYAKTLIYTGPLGPYQVPGRSVFIGTIAWGYYLFLRGEIAAPPEPDPPDEPGFLSILAPIIEPPSSGIGFMLSFLNVNEKAVVLAVQLSFAFNPTRMFFKGPWRPATLETLEIEPETSGIVEYKALTEDRAYFLTARFISKLEPHRISPEVISRGIAVPKPTG